MLTQDLLRDYCSASSATLLCSSLRSWSRKAACSRMLSEWSFETRRRFRMAAASSAPSEAYGARPIPSFTAHRYRLNPFSKMLRGARSTEHFAERVQAVSMCGEAGDGPGAVRLAGRRGSRGHSESSARLE